MAAGTAGGRVVVPASPALAARGLGMAAVALSAAFVAALGAAGLLEGTARTVSLVALLVVAVPLLGAALTQGFRLLGRGARLVHSPEGFENRTSLFGVGTRKAAWTEVTGLSEVPDVLVIELSDQRRSLVDCRVLGRTPGSLAEELRPYVGRPLT